MSTQRTNAHFSAPDIKLPFQSTMDKAHGYISTLSLTVRIPTRKNIGLDMLKKSHLAASTGLMLVTSGIGNLHVGFSLFSGLQVMHGNDNSLFNYAFAVLLLGGWERHKRLEEEKLGTEPHTFWPGDDRFGLYDFIPLQRKYIDMLVVPAVVFIAGAVCRYRLHFGLLGLWLMASAVALWITEKMWQIEKDKFVRMHKNLGKEAQWWAEYERTRPKGAPAKDTAQSSSATIPTGSDDTLDALIEKNKRDNSFLN